MQTTLISDARAILTDPDFAARHPDARTCAWVALKSQRGQTVNQTRLNQLRRSAEVIALFGEVA